MAKMTIDDSGSENGDDDEEDEDDKFDWGIYLVCQGGVGYGTSHQIDIPISEETQFYTVECTHAMFELYIQCKMCKISQKLKLVMGHLTRLTFRLVRRLNFIP